VAIRNQLCIRTALATILNCLIAGLCFAQAAPQISAADIYERAHSSVVVVIVSDRNSKPIGLGSGFIVAKDRIVTNHHVVKGAKDALVVFADGTSELVEGVAADSPARDLAILVVKTGSRLPLKLGDELSVRQGDSVYALGAPRGLELSLTNGIVSGFRDVDDQFLLQTTAPIAPGSSGGPLFDSSGRVIGVTTAFLIDSPGIYFSIGARDVSRLLRAPSSVILPLASMPAISSETDGSTAEARPPPKKAEPPTTDVPITVEPTARGGIHVVTNIVGATAVLHGAAGWVLSKCQTPCSFNDLWPSPYSLEVQKGGYQSVQMALRVKSGEVQEQTIRLDELSSLTPASGRTEPMLSAEVAEYAGRIEEVIAEKGLTGRAKVQRNGNTIVLVGKLRPTEHGALLKFLRDAPTNVRIVDHIEYDTPVATSGNTDVGRHPVPSPDRGAIHVVADVIGATAVLHELAGRVLNKCETPCSFNNLAPARYRLEVQKDGYQPVQTVLQVEAGDVSDQKVRLEPLTNGLFVSSQPPGADVFINGAKQSGQTPVTLPLAPGQYNLVLRLGGYEAYAGSIQVKDNIQTQLNVTLNEKSAMRVAWAQVNTNPKGAEILVDGTSTGQFTPARVQMSAGLHTVILRLNGYQPTKRTVQVSEGGTVTIDESLRQE
jgi:trypsin-like peptidase/PEGA domain-containing protein